MDKTKRAILVAFGANVGLAVAKFLGFLFTGSASLLAEACHSLADTSNQGLLLVGRVRARRKESPRHPFGYGKERFFWAFLVSVLILVGGAFVAIYGGIRALLAPQPLAQPAWGLAVLLVALLLDGASLVIASRTATRRGQEGWYAFIRRTKKPEIPVILLEDAASVTGVLVAIVAISLSMATGNPVWDAIGSLVIGVLLTIMALVLARETQSLLIGEAASPETQALVRRTLLEDPAIEALVYVRTLHVGPEEFFVEAKVEMDPDMTVRQVAFAIDRIEARMRVREPRARIISIEPDVPHPDDPDRPRYEPTGP